MIRTVVFIFQFCLVVSLFLIGFSPSSTKQTYLEAIDKGDMETLKYLESEDYQSKTNDPNKDPAELPIHYAVKKGKLSLIPFFIENGHDINKENDQGLTPLSYAVNSNDLRAVQSLLDVGAVIPEDILKHASSPEGVILLSRQGVVLSKKDIKKGASDDTVAAIDTEMQLAEDFSNNAAKGELKKVQNYINSGRSVNNVVSSDPTASSNWTADMVILPVYRLYGHPKVALRWVVPRRKQIEVKTRSYIGLI